MTIERKKWIIWFAAATAAMVLLGPAVAVRADEHHRDREGQWWQHGDIRHFRDGDLHRWQSGHWVRTRHGGRSGWWWVVGGVWYFYPAPIYPYPNPYVPPVAVTSTPPPAQAAVQYWYYCNSARGYYPYVTSCPEGWMQVVPQP